MNEGGVLVDRTTQYATTTDVPGDQGFLTPTCNRHCVVVDVDNDGWPDVVTATALGDFDPKNISHPRVYMNRGKAKLGDKTMVDALHPAADKAQEVAAQPLGDALAAVAAAAEAGKDSSKAMIATLGRAKTLGQASIGHPDAGALSVTVICAAMCDYVAE